MDTINGTKNVYIKECKSILQNIENSKKSGENIEKTISYVHNIENIKSGVQNIDKSKSNVPNTENSIKQNIENDKSSLKEEIDNPYQFDLINVENIISKDNTSPIFIQTYLTLLKELKKIELLKKKIKKYEYFVPKELINQEFSEFYEKKLSSAQLLNDLFQKIITYLKTFSFDKKVKFYKEFCSILPDFSDDDIKGFTDYKTNKELSIFILAQKIKNGIIKHIKQIHDYKENQENPLIKLNKEMLKEVEIIKKVQNFNEKKCNEQPTAQEIQLYEKRKLYIKSNNFDDLIKNLNEEISLLSIIDTDKFSNYFNNLSRFLKRVKQHFDKRFKNIEKLEFDEFKLMRDFFFFIAHYDFSDLDEINFYSNKWINTFSQSQQDINKLIQEKSIKNIAKYEIKDNVLTLTIVNNLDETIDVIKIKNIEKYSIHSVISYLSKLYSDLIDYNTNEPKINEVNINKANINEVISKTINEFEIENLLKFDFIQDIFINKYMKIIEEHLIKIFTSPVIKAVFETICKKIGFSKYYDFLNENDLKSIFNRARIFQFQTDFIGLTEPSFFTYYIYYRGKIGPSYSEDYSKLLNLCFYQVTQEHEILGHLNLRLQNYLFNEQKSSPIIDYKELSINEKKGPESGDAVEILLYGQNITELSFNEMLFLLDLDNYNVELDKFKDNFIGCKERSYTISNDVSNFLELLGINIKDGFKINKELAINDKLIKKNKFKNNNYKFYREQRHAEYLHPPPKMSVSTKEFLDELYQSYFKNK